jgi:hypothetical protein
VPHRGDTGEGTHPQFAVVPGLLEAGKKTSFLVVMSDVIYPIGNVTKPIGVFRHGVPLEADARICRGSSRVGTP